MEEAWATLVKVLSFSFFSNQSLVQFNKKYYIYI